MEGDETVSRISNGQSISIHALRVEGDVGMVYDMLIEQTFLSTPSGWRATDAGERSHGVVYISIHALRVEGDRDVGCLQQGTDHFYPRPPGGGRPV